MLVTRWLWTLFGHVTSCSVDRRSIQLPLCHMLSTQQTAAAYIHKYMHCMSFSYDMLTFTLSCSLTCTHCLCFSCHVITFMLSTYQTAATLHAHTACVSATMSSLSCSAHIKQLRPYMHKLPVFQLQCHHFHTQHKIYSCSLTCTLYLCFSYNMITFMLNTQYTAATLHAHTACVSAIMWSLSHSANKRQLQPYMHTTPVFQLQCDHFHTQHITNSCNLTYTQCLCFGYKVITFMLSTQYTAATLHAHTACVSDTICSFSHSAHDKQLQPYMHALPISTMMWSLLCLADNIQCNLTCTHCLCFSYDVITFMLSTQYTTANLTCTHCLCFSYEVITFMLRGLIHETDLRAKLRPKPEVRNYRRKVAIHESGQREVAT